MYAYELVTSPSLRVEIHIDESDGQVFEEEVNDLTIALIDYLNEHLNESSFKEYIMGEVGLDITRIYVEES